MIYQLGKFEKWINIEIAPENLTKNPSPSLLKEQLEFARTEKERICDYFKAKAIGQESYAPLSKLVQTHQVGLTALIAAVYTFGQQEDSRISPELATFYNKVCQIIDEIIILLSQHFPEVFNQDLPITNSRADLSRLELRRQLETLNPIKENQAIDKALIRMTFWPFREFVEDGKKISYRQLKYLDDLADGLRRLLDFEGDVTYELHLTLIQLNFNYPRYVLHFNYWLDAKLAEIPDRGPRLDKLSWYINAIEQIRFKPGVVLIPDLPSITEQLITSIKNTYRYLLTDYQHSDHTVVTQIGKRAKPDHPKIKLAVSVPVLALFVKTLIKAGIIINDNKSEVFRGVAENFATLKTDSISQESLKGKYNKIPPSAYLHLKRTLTRLIEITRQL